MSLLFAGLICGAAEICNIAWSPGEEGDGSGGDTSGVSEVGKPTIRSVPVMLSILGAACGPL